jgi:hypothetical protein
VFKSKLFKLGYGYDISGETGSGGGTSGQQKEVSDQAQPWTQHQTGPSPVNVMRDSDAEEEFPQIVKKPNIFPSRNVK